MKPLRTVAAIVIFAGLVAVLGLAVACSDNGDAQGKSEGEAVTAVSQFFEQERAGGRLPEGVEGIIKRGVKTNSVVPEFSVSCAATAASYAGRRSLCVRASFSRRGRAFSNVWRSARISSVSMTEMSSTGSIQNTVPCEPLQ